MRFGPVYAFAGPQPEKSLHPAHALPPLLPTLRKILEQREAAG
jgi:hypothetical protein